MERDNTLKAKLEDFLIALHTFQQSLNLDLRKYDDIELDTIKNGQVQKFEYCAEICWKMIKVFLIDVHGVEVLSPKSAVKEFFKVGLISEQEYELLIQMLDDRNRLSHIYNEKYFDDIYSNLNDYFLLMKKVAGKMK
jgi:nucleotidyltransferase substrate binding protein (TIGR01987 family)